MVPFGDAEGICKRMKSKKIVDYKTFIWTLRWFMEWMGTDNIEG